MNNKDPYSAAGSIDQIFTLSGLRSDHWRTLLTLARKWTAGKVERDHVVEAFNALRPIELLHAYPGPLLMDALSADLQADRQEAFLALVGRISFSILARYYKEDPHEWDLTSDYAEGHEVVHPANERPYFEVLVVAPDNAPRIKRNLQLMRTQRHKEDEFIYEPVVVTNFQDAFCAVATNANICAVVLFDGFGFSSRLPVPQLERMMETLHIHQDD
ncbi:MAG: decarboxylase, partial [Pseudomonadaceae bacterium]